MLGPFLPVTQAPFTVGQQSVDQNDWETWSGTREPHIGKHKMPHLLEPDGSLDGETPSPGSEDVMFLVSSPCVFPPGLQLYLDSDSGHAKKGNRRELMHGVWSKLHGILFSPGRLSFFSSLSNRDVQGQGSSALLVQSWCFLVGFSDDRVGKR